MKANTSIRITLAEVLKMVKQLRDRIKDTGVTLTRYRIPPPNSSSSVLRQNTPLKNSALCVTARFPPARDNHPSFRPEIDRSVKQPSQTLLSDPPMRVSTFSRGSSAGPTENYPPPISVFLQTSPK